MTICNPLRRATWIVALSACAASVASGADSGFYLGANAGVTTFKTDEADLTAQSLTTGTLTFQERSIDDKSFGFSLNFGYRLNRYIGAEIGLFDMGDLEARERFTQAPGIGGYADATLGTRGASLSVIGTFPLNKFEFFGRAGIARAETELQYRLAPTFGTGVPSGGIFRKEDSDSLIYGAGVGYTFGEAFFLKLEYSLMAGVSSEDEEIGLDTDVGLLSLGLQYRF